ncbi:hypothetical protein PQX77_002287, partial [Marasmius sp. AFHP31]
GFALACTLPGTSDNLRYISDTLSQNTLKKWKIVSTLKVLPRGDLERVRTELSGSRLEVYSVSFQQRATFTEEVAAALRNEGIDNGNLAKADEPGTGRERRISTKTFDDIVAKCLLDTPIKVDAGQSDGSRASQLFRVFSRMFS